MRLTNRDKFQLITEVLVTLMILLVFDLAAIMSIDVAVKNNPLLNLGIVTLRSAFFATRPLRPDRMPRFPQGIYLRWWLIIPLIIVNVVVVGWQIKRRFHLIQINHIVSELQYIANNHFDHRIAFSVQGKTQRIINNINKLVDSVIKSIHQRRVVEHSKDNLITNVSHDIRTPLTSIIGYLGLIESRHCSQQELYQYAHIAYFKAKQMKNLANELFEYTKISRNQVPMHYNLINVHQMLEQLAIGDQLRAKKYGMRILVKDHNFHLKLKADAAKLGRALNDLIFNAIKYGHDGKHIFLSARLIRKRTIRIIVANDGHQIPKSALNLIFSRFYRVEQSRNRQTGGSGLGLAIVANIVRLHHGMITVKSDSVQTQFIIDLPIVNG